MKKLAIVVTFLFAVPIAILAFPIALTLYILKGIALGVIEFCEVLTGGKKL